MEIEKFKLKLIWKMKGAILHTCVLLLVLFSLLCWLHMSRLLNFGVLCKCGGLEVESDNNWHAGQFKDTRGNLTQCAVSPTPQSAGRPQQQIINDISFLK